MSKMCSSFKAFSHYLLLNQSPTTGLWCVLNRDTSDDAFNHTYFCPQSMAIM